MENYLIINYTYVWLVLFICLFLSCSLGLCGHGVGVSLILFLSLWLIIFHWVSSSCSSSLWKDRSGDSYGTELGQLGFPSIFHHYPAVEVALFCTQLIPLSLAYCCHSPFVWWRELGLCQVHMGCAFRLVSTDPFLLTLSYPPLLLQRWHIGLFPHL